MTAALQTGTMRAAQPPASAAHTLGYWSALVGTVAGVAYFLVIVAAMLTGQFTFPPPEWLQLFGGLISLLFCPVMVALMAALHTTAPADRRIFSQAGLAFTILFAFSVSANRFTQLGVVRQSVAAGSADGVDWFLAYAGHSVMFGFEIMGWGWFLSLALLSVVPLFGASRLERWLRALCALYGLLGLISAAAFLLESPLVSVGFAAWGLLLFIITALLAVLFKRGWAAAPEKGLSR
jgi:hypothetical protein